MRSYALFCLVLVLLPAAILARAQQGAEDGKDKPDTAAILPEKERSDHVESESPAPKEAAPAAVSSPKEESSPVSNDDQPQPQQQQVQQQQQHSQQGDAQARQSNSGAQVASNRQSNQGNNLFSNLLQPLSPGNFLNNLLPGRNSERRQIGETCQYSSDCLAGTDNSVCFNGTCLCNLGYRYTADTKQCTPVDTCPTCTTDTCSSGTDVYCNGTCIRNMKAIQIKGIGETGKMMLTSPNWPENYPAGTDVYYCITASVGRRVNIKFDWMDLETNCGYNCDYVRVYNGCVGKSQELVAMFHGDNARSRECVTSTCNQMLVHFHTDPDKGGRGDQRSGFMGFIREATYTNDLCNKCSGPK